MKVTKVNLLEPPDRLLRALEASEVSIKAGRKGQLNEDQMAEGIARSAFLPPDTKRPTIISYLDDEKLDRGAPGIYRLVSAREKARMSACGDKLFAGYTNTSFDSESMGVREAKCATIAHLWMPNATFHAHGNEDGDINKGFTFEDYVVKGGGPAWYVMGSDVYFVEPEIDPELGEAGWEIPPGCLHGVFSEEPDNPALAVLRFHHQGLALRTDTADKTGWGWPRDEKVYTFASRAISGMIDIANGRTPSVNFPPSFVQKVQQYYATS